MSAYRKPPEDHSDRSDKPRNRLRLAALLLMSLVVCIVPVLPTSFSLERLAIGVITSGVTLAVTGCFAWWYSGKQRALRQLRIEAKAEEMIRRFDRSASKD